VFKGLFFNVWSKLKSMNPSNRQSARSTTVYTAGVRGAESTESLIQPYWKGDLSEDEAFQAQLQSFSQAQQLMDSGKLADSAKAFGSFLDKYATSSLAPNARFARGLCHAGLGQNAQAKSDLQQFADDYPNHPLATDVNQLVGQL
jgi:TolA-binding protein